ncbi:MAG: glycine zipper 2TM domain-containing protein [Steroidobacterales bacterium]
MNRVSLRLAAPLGPLLLLGACVQEPVRTVAVPAPQPAMVRMFVYPAKGQTEEQLERDRYECHSWAVQQSGFDPSRSDGQGYRTVVVQPAPGSGTAAGAIGGAILGSILAGPRDSGFGALFGAATGAIVGSSVDANNQAQAAQTQQQINQQAWADRARVQGYRRAVSACLEARGYTVG